ncbi:asparaginase domain-containing protein [Christiangramia portivictoriae]|uniref:asparaginase domain-containing protein n=1 Tax=Christiangramia portivictoriae TaxID=326069 RepID=UPI00047CE406|nr:asparaginase domain-containing protein [Christiangramia portivictoriae]
MIQIFTTGGTIEGLDYTDDGGITSSDVGIMDFLDKANIDFEYTIEGVFKKDSRAITENDRKLLVEKIKATNTNKILVTHGTYTMEDTAKYIGNRSLNKTIILVGAFILGTSKDTDAPFNLGYAICALQFLKSDVYIAMNGKLFHWNDVTKNLDTNKFESNE